MDERMKKAILLVSLLFLAGCATTQSAIKNNASFSKYKKVYLAEFDNDPRHVLPKARKHLGNLGFEVVMAGEDAPFWGTQGTGFIISADGYLLTSAHVLGAKKEATAWLNGKRYEAELVSIGVEPESQQDKKQQKPRHITDALNASVNSKQNRSIQEELNDRDIALLKIKASGETFIPVSFAAAPRYAMGQDVYTIGFPLTNILGIKPRLNKGLISSTVGIKDHPHFVQISAEIQPGNSGGPLLNDEGQVVGMVQMTLDPSRVYSQTGATPQNVNFALKSHALRDFLQENGDTAKLVFREGEVVPFENAQNSIVQIQGGIVPEGFREEPKLVCNIQYSYIWDMWFRFQLLDVTFYDMDTQETLLRAGQYGDNPLSTEDATLENVFKDVKLKMGIRGTRDVMREAR